ncbi:MFS transporter [Solirubrobacter phytolaccae]|uniref:MFS transporter n=1 Tax=Solirubrobacter phytolaccae TaxID=1404360 RepID=A0A9X3SC92_9ACTN|nr:MFS transporter [Solirubrobacter phytolaccae]MDA0184371.1 MFS transporter [Solirubrobacter phytolaccae]
MNRTTLCACAPAFLGAFDFGLLALAGPRIAAEVGAAGPAYPWLFSASSFAYGAVVLPAAALSARWGPPRALGVGLTVAATGSVLFALAAGLPLALAGRALFGAGGAMAATAALALLAGTVDERTRRAGFAALGGAVGGGFAAGALSAGVPAWRVVVALVAALCVAVAREAPRLGRGERVSLSSGPARVTPGEVRAGLPSAPGGRVAAAQVRGARAVTPSGRRSPMRVASVARAGWPSRAGRRVASVEARAERPTEPRRRVASAPVRAALPSGSALLSIGIVLAAVALARRESAIALPLLAAAGLVAVAGLRRASRWLPRPRGALARVCLAGAATTASGVSATILVGAAFAEGAAPTALLGVFGLAVLPGAWLAAAIGARAGHPAAAAAGLLVQAAALVGLAAALDASSGWPVLAAAIVAFGVGHVAANAGAAGAVATLAGVAAPAVGALLIAAQYLGGGAAPVLIAADGAEARGVLVAGLIALCGALLVLTDTIRDVGASRDGTSPVRTASEVIE